MELTTELSLANGQGIANQAASVANEVSGKPCIWGGKTSDGFDCSCFVAYVLAGLYPNQYECPIFDQRRGLHVQ